MSLKSTHKSVYSENKVLLTQTEIRSQAEISEQVRGETEHVDATIWGSFPAPTNRVRMVSL